MTIKRTEMRGMRVAVLALCTFAVSAAPMMAQDNSMPPPAQGQQAPMGPGGRRDPAQMEERQVERLTKRLHLTPDQATQVKAIDDAQRAQMMALRNDTSIAPEDRRSKIMTMRQDTETKIRAVLTDEQKPRYDAMLAEQRQRMSGRQGGSPPPQ